MKNVFFSPGPHLVWGWGVYREVKDSQTCLPSCRPGEALAPLPCRSCCPRWPTRSLTAPPRSRWAPRSALTAPQPRWRRKKTWMKEERDSPGLCSREGRSYRSLLMFLQVRHPSVSGAAPSAGCAASYETLHAGSWTTPNFKKKCIQINADTKTLVLSQCMGWGMTQICWVWMTSYLDSRLGQVGAHGQAFTHHHVRVVCLLKGFLQSLELLRGEGCATPSLLTMLRAVTSLEYNVLKCAAVFWREKKERYLINRTSRCLYMCREQWPVSMLAESKTKAFCTILLDILLYNLAVLQSCINDLISIINE